MTSQSDSTPDGAPDMARELASIREEMVVLEQRLNKSFRKFLGAPTPTPARPVDKTLMVPAHMVWREQPFYTRARAACTVEGIPELRCFFLQSCIRSLAALDGAVAEIGVRHGKSCLYMLEADMRHRHYYLFDSFEGLSPPDAGKDLIERAYDDEGKPHFADTDADAVRARFAPHPNVSVLQGWVPERFDEVGEARFALVHVDVDHHAPTLASLEFFYPRLLPGGMLICDDYGSGFFPGARMAMDDFFADKPESPVELPQGQAFIVRRGTFDGVDPPS